MPDKSRTALITGASRGLGLALASALAERGWRLILDARDSAALAAAARQVESFGAPVVALAGDVADPAHVAALSRATGEAGGLDALILNASTLGPSPRPVLREYPLDALRRVLDVNLIAPLAIVQALEAQLREGSRILAVTSDAGVEPYFGWGGYGASKAALEHLFAILAEESPQWRVYRVDPGDMRTQMHQEAFPGEDIGDRPLPVASVPGFLRLLTEDLPSGRYVARDLAVPEEEAR